MRYVLCLFLLACACTAGTSASRAEERFALLIANLSYNDDVGRLKNPQRDIDIVASALQQIGFPADRIVKKVDLSSAQLMKEVREHVARVKAAGAGTWSFIYYSGHGAAAGRSSATAEQGDNFIIPVDAENPQNADFWKGAVNLDEIGRELETAPEAVHFVIFDACRTELNLPNRALNGRGFVPVSFSEQPGMLFAFASAPNSLALDGLKGEDNGPYALAISQEIIKPGVDHLHLFANIRTEVYNRTGRRQTPWIRDGFMGIVYITPPNRPSTSLPDAKPEQCVASADTKPVQPLVWEPVADKHRVVFTRSAMTLEEPRADAPAIEDISKDYVHRIAAGSTIQVGKVNGRPAWYRYVRDVGSRQERFVSVDDVDLLK